MQPLAQASAPTSNVREFAPVLLRSGLAAVWKPAWPTPMRVRKSSSVAGVGAGVAREARGTAGVQTAERQAWGIQCNIEN